jgi:guanylate kinase
MACKNLYLHSEPRLIILSAPSGGGKTSLVKRFLTDHKSEFVQSVSVTTRAPRPGEVSGIDYNFVSIADFRAKLATSEFLEHAEVHGNYYGTSKTQIDQALADGKSVFLLIDVSGAHRIKKIYGPKAQLIFIRPPDLHTLEQRLRGRNTDSEEVIQRRLRNAVHELSFESQFEKVVINDNFEKAYADLIDAVYKP